MRRGKLIGQRENVYQHFKFTKRATRNIVTWGALFPAFIAGVAYVYDVRLIHLQMKYLAWIDRWKGQADSVGQIRLGREIEGFESDSGSTCTCCQARRGVGAGSECRTNALVPHCRAT